MTDKEEEEEGEERVRRDEEEEGLSVREVVGVSCEEDREEEGEGRGISPPSKTPFPS